MANSRFAVAVHLLTMAMVACGEAERGMLTSDRMATSVDTNPVFIRRILGALREAGLVTSQPGPGGGWRLARPPEAVTLLDVYRAVGGAPMLGAYHHPPNQGCPVGPHIQRVLDGYFRDAEAAMEAKLGEISIAEVVWAMLAECGASGPRGCGRPPTIL